MGFNVGQSEDGVLKANLPGNACLMAGGTKVILVKWAKGAQYWRIPYFLSIRGKYYPCSLRKDTASCKSWPWKDEGRRTITDNIVGGDYGVLNMCSLKGLSIE